MAGQGRFFIGDTQFLATFTPESSTQGATRYVYSTSNHTTSHKPMLHVLKKNENLNTKPHVFFRSALISGFENTKE